LGDVIIEGDDIHGDGVNIAARLEGLCEPGAVYVSGTVYDQAAGKLEASFEDLGEQAVKNIAKPVRVYRLRGQSAETANTADTTASLPLPDKPSIAVLPFENMSGDPEQEYFADGIAEDIITGLSRFHWFFVIARNSSFTYKGSAVDVKQVARELGVQYVLEGSVRKGGNRVRITAQLIDALTGRHVWAERYDRDLDDIFAVQDEISEAITTTVAPAFISAEAQRAERKLPESFDAWDFCMRGNWHLSRRGREDIARARQLFEEALERDPNSSMALSGLAFALGWTINSGWFDDLDQVRDKALAAAQRAVDLDENDAWAHAVLGFVNFYAQRLDASLVECQHALQLNPNLAVAEAILAFAYSWGGDYDDAVEHAKNAIRLSPRDTHSLGSFAYAVAEFGAGRYEQAAGWARKTTEVTPDLPAGWRYLAASLAHVDRLEEAQLAVNRLLQTAIHDSISATRAIYARLPLASADFADRVIDGLRKAGLPE
jgi:TolB-like protein/Tfp pilus assembly protein PilF